MRNGMAETVAEANAQQFTLPARLDDWLEIAMLLDGYTVGQELLGLDVISWGNDQQQQYDLTGQWDLTVLELRLMLFHFWRVDYWTGETYHELDPYVDSLLHALSQQTGLPYPAVDSESHSGE
jgi:hypothetical protein